MSKWKQREAIDWSELCNRAREKEFEESMNDDLDEIIVHILD